MKCTRILTILLSLGLAMTASRPAHAQLTVGGCVKGTTYSTIQSAVDAAASGSIIKVCPGGYAEQVVINKPLTLEGFIQNGAEGAFVFPPAGGVVQNDSPYAPQVLVKNTSGVTIINLIVDGQNAAPCGVIPMVGIEFHNASGMVNKVSVHNQAGLACLAYGFDAVVDFGQAAQTVTLQNSEFHNQTFYGIYGNGPGLTLNTLNNYVSGPDNAGTSTVGIAYRSGATGNIQGNTVVDEIYPQYVFADPELLGSMGIGVFCTTATVSGNTVSNTQIGIAVGCNTVNGAYTSNSTIKSNKVFKTRLQDAIYIFSNGNKVTNNTLVASGQAGIHLDPTYSVDASGNTVSGNSIVEACAGILATGTVTNTLTSNSFSAVDVTTTAGASCGPILQ